MSANNLESLYAQAQQALKARDYDRATDLLKQILVINDDYKDASRLLARIVKVKRRRWYNDARIWGTFGVLLLVGLGFFIAQKLSGYYAAQPTAQVIDVTKMPSPIVTAAPTQTHLPTPTPIPLTWKRIYGGGEFRRAIITAIVVDPRDADVVYVGTKSAGIYKSIDGGLSWKPAHRGLLLANVDTLVIDPDNPNILYVGIVSAGVYKTTDGGENWQVNLEDLNGKVSEVIMDQTDSSHLYYTQGWEIRQSKDGGESWMDMNSSKFSFEIVSLVMHPADSKTLLMGGSDGGIYISHNEGVTWALLYATQKHTTDERISELKIDSNTGDLILVNSPERYDTSSVYGSSDGGKTLVWRSRINCKTLAIHPDGKTIFCGATEGTIHISTDAAQTWSFLTVLPIGQVGAIAISPHDPNVLLAGGDGLFISFDGGRNWEERSNGLGRGIIELGIDPADNTKFYVVDGEKSDGGGEVIYRSLDQGLSWKFISKYCRLIFGLTGNLSCSQRYAPNQEEFSPQINASFCGFLDAANPYRQGEVYSASAGCGGLYISVDGGRSWHNTNVSEELGDARFFFATDQKTIYAIPTWMWRHIWKSIDGANWESCGEIKTGISSTKSRFAIDPNNSDIVYLATRGDGVYTSQDGCKSWQTSNAGLDNLFVNTIVTDARDSNIVYAGTDSGAYISYNGGQVWGLVNDGLLGATVVYSIAVDKDSNVYATTPYGIFKLESK